MKFAHWLWLLYLFLPLLLKSAEWPSGSGPIGNFSSTQNGPLKWSVSLDQNIAWKLILPETGQSTPVISNGRVYFSTMKPVEKDSTLGKDIVAWCCDSGTGKVLWKRAIPGQYPLRLSGCFGDSTSPPAVCSNKRVVFLNASGRVTCFDLEGKIIWDQPFLSVGRTIPFLHDGKYIFTRQIYPPEPSGNFPHKYSNSPKNMWTQLQALHMSDGKIAWTSECGVNMGISTLRQKKNDGRTVAVVGRGGGHGPPERPFGISMIDLLNGKTLWTLPIDGFLATMTFSIHNGQVHIFHLDKHLSIDEISGKVKEEISILEKVTVCRMTNGKRQTRVEKNSPEFPTAFYRDLTKKNRAITQGSNLIVGDYHYFRSYVRPWLGRVNLKNKVVEYLELPIQISRSKNRKDEFKWFLLPTEKKSPKLTTQGFGPNEMVNSRGFKVVGDKRSHGNGWGHIASPTPTIANDRLYVPVMNGTVYVIDTQARVLNGKAILAINDLGPIKHSFTRSSLSFANGNAYAHTIKELICIQN